MKKWQVVVLWGITSCNYYLECCLATSLWRQDLWQSQASWRKSLFHKKSNCPINFIHVTYVSSVLSACNTPYSSRNAWPLSDNKIKIEKLFVCVWPALCNTVERLWSSRLTRNTHKYKHPHTCTVTHTAHDRAGGKHCEYLKRSRVVDQFWQGHRDMDTDGA